MMIKTLCTLPLFTLIALASETTEANLNTTQEDLANASLYLLPDYSVQAPQTANIRPASTFETLVSNLDFDPRIDLQSRNMAEAQGDISIRGGIFEASGIQVGASTLFDPQTGHYTTELPIAPEMLGNPILLTGTENALRGFNSTAGTLSYDWTPIIKGGSYTLGAGENNLNFQRIHNASVKSLEKHKDWTVGYEAEISRSESDGTIRYSDHNFDRTSARIQFIGPNSQTDFFAGYLAKKFGHKGMYTGDLYATSFETENVKTSLFLINHQQNYASDSHWEATAYYRSNSDHYIFNRFSPNYSYVHDTEVFSLGLSGFHALDPKFALNYTLQLTEDAIDSTTLEQGHFTSRNYYKFSLLPQYTHSLNERQNLILKAGASYDDTNRNDSKISPIAEINLLTNDGGNAFRRAYLSYAETTQVIGYGAIGGSEDSGLFQSKHDLLREKSKNIELGYALDRSDWSVQTAVFYRWDEDLVDWTYTGSGARSASNVDIETFGFEALANKRWESLEATVSYAYLEKSEDYKNASVIGSFYALNVPKHRATLSLIHTVSEQLEIKLDNEWRHHSENALRTGPNHAFFSHLGLSFYPNPSHDKEIFLSFEKPWGEAFQEIPGTPGRGDQFSFGLRSQW